MGPRRFLDAWEPWLQTSLAASRYALGRVGAATKPATLWRFWLGPALVGDATVGVLMASVDGVGPRVSIDAVLDRERAAAAAGARRSKATTSGSKRRKPYCLALSIPAPTFEHLAGAAAALAAPVLHAPDIVHTGIEDLPITPSWRQSEMRASARRSSDPASLAARGTILSAS